MPTFAPEPRPGSLLAAGPLVEVAACLILLTVSVVAGELLGGDFEGREVEVEVKGVNFEANQIEFESTKMLDVDRSKEFEILFN